jgi:hypothetical protein
MGTQRGQMIGILPWLVCWTRRAGTIDCCLASASLVSPVQNIIILALHFSTLLHTIVPIAQQPGQAGVLGRLSLCLWLQPQKVRTRESIGRQS